ncbi:Proton-dependent oligopeptide transporter family [Corchorus capsularis]|uniref:Proton-dependent oligopeptide transporter family n=1 Tax=Corchorus capsularis TaxID=210143 RepID=A0A1R3H7Z0_COCAP|nr:Proton-dependent oligopeptide transporter family [Corchorus capsularis]
MGKNTTVKEMEDGFDSMQEISQNRSKKSPGGWRAVKYILGNETFEKLASMSLIANLTVYLKTKFNMDGIAVVNVMTIWSGCSNLTSIAGALVSDTFLGRYLTLLFGSISSLLGMATVTLTAAVPELRPPKCQDSINCIGPKLWQMGVLIAGLALLAIGAGGIRPCNIAFGADQFDTTTKKGRAQLESFFNWWYFTFTLALVIALTGVVYVQTNVSWAIGFAIPTACLFFSIAIFVIGRHSYIISKPQGSVFVDIAKVIVASIRKHGINGNYPFYDPEVPGSESKIERTKRFSCLDKAAIIVNQNELDEQGKPKNEWRLCSVEKVENLKMLVGMLPVWITGIFCFIVMDQQGTVGMLQAIQSTKTLKSIPHFEIPPAWMGLSSMIALAIWIFIYEKIWVSLTKRMTGKPKRLSVTQRINIGIVMSILCTLVAALTERHRRTEALKKGSFESPVSILLLLPQFALSGLVEAFAAVAVMEFLTTQLPESMRTVAGAIFFVSLSIASYLNSVIVNIVYRTTKKSGTQWLGGSDLNKDRLEYYYCLIAGIGAMNLLYFNVFARHFVTNNVRKEPEDEQKNEERTLESA